MHIVCLMLCLETNLKTIHHYDQNYNMNIHNVFNQTRLFSTVLTFFIAFLPISQAQVKINFSNPKHKFSVGEAINVRISTPDWGVGKYEIYYNPRKSVETTIQKGEFTASPGADGFISFSPETAGAFICFALIALPGC